MYPMSGITLFELSFGLITQIIIPPMRIAKIKIKYLG